MYKNPYFVSRKKKRVRHNYNKSRPQHLSTKVINKYKTIVSSDQYAQIQRNLIEKEISCIMFKIEEINKSLTDLLMCRIFFDDCIAALLREKNVLEKKLFDTRL